MKKNFWRMTSILTAAAFVSNVLLYETGLSLETRVSGIEAQNVMGLDIVSEFDTSFDIPVHLGRVEKYELFPDVEKMIVHIQDAHCNYACQKSIAGIIDHFSEKYGIKTINLEGGSGKYDLSVFTEISDLAVRGKVTDYFVKEGILSGAEYYTANNPKNVRLWGIEDVDLYLSHLEVYRNSLKYKKSVNKGLASLNSVLKVLKERLYNEPLMEMDKMYTEYKSGDMEFRDYLGFLSDKIYTNGLDIKRYPNVYLLMQTMDLEDNIDFRTATTQRNILIDEIGRRIPLRMLEDLTVKTLEFRSGRISPTDFYGYLSTMALRVGVNFDEFPELSKYRIYLSLYDGVDKSRVMPEMEMVEEDIKDLIYENVGQKELNALSRNMTLLENMFSIRLTRDDYEYYRTNTEDFSVKSFMAFIDRESSSSGVELRLCSSVAELDARREEISDFYEYAFRRDKVFVENIRYDDGSFSEAKKYAMLVTGGFHSESLYELFREKGISYISIMPGFVDDIEHENPYFSLLSGESENVLAVLLAERDPRRSALALYSFFCETSPMVKGLEKVEYMETWVALVKAVFSKDISTDI